MKKIALAMITLLLICGSLPASAMLKEPLTAEIYDPYKQQVVKHIELTPSLLSEAKFILTHLEFTSRLNLNFNSGKLIKFPVQTHVQNQWFNGDIREFILIVEQTDTYVLLFDKQDQARLFATSYDVAPLLKRMDSQRDARFPQDKP
ncbi:hypothetical protein [Gorillibacterium massiliense]|uniref:hypothetical protein n=1 Tax=Gorillibacterium massiliense TaxID=1280390 RepID=UPI0004B8E6F5|nr:hypothetical protein [Gorillibacterium massiliense]